MLIGHVGAGLALGSAERRLNPGLVVLAAVWLDVLLWSFVLFGWESVAVPADYASRHLLTFTFPYSHSLLACGLWALAAGMFGWTIARHFGVGRMRTAIILSMAVLSHWVLDLLVHIPDLPIAGTGSPMAGFSLWNHMWIALTVEGLIALVGLWLYMKGSALSLVRKIVLSVLVIVVIVFTILGQTSAPPPTNVRQVAAASLALNLALVLAVYFLTRKSSVRRAAAKLQEA